MKTFEEATRLLRENDVGRGAAIDTPYGRRFLCYADLTATGRHLELVEEWVRRVRPFYANSHTSISSTGRLMTELREEARRVVRRSIRAGEDDIVLFVGSGATAAVNKLAGLLGLRIPEPLEREHSLSARIPPERRPLVLVGPYEHHSNELPWLESIADVLEVGLDAKGAIDLADLEAKLSAHAERPLKIGAFSAASNVTGLLTDVQAVARALHRGGALACFDYAAAAPYVPIDMHPHDPEARIDALYLSTHKFVGGPEGSGILACHRSLVRTRTPERPGGGTVDYVGECKRASVDYVQRLEEREEGGTPAILGDLRAGAAFLVKEMVGPSRILAHETAVARRAVARLSRHPRILLLGGAGLYRLAILSFNVERLHHDLVSALLDQLFGIQNRAGCSCAGPYGHRLLGISRARSEQFRLRIAEGILGIKPGWVRISLPYHASDEDLEFILSAVELVAEHGRDFVPAYRLGWRDGVWRLADGPAAAGPRLELSTGALAAAAAGPPDRSSGPPVSDEELRAARARYFEEAHRAAAALRERWAREKPRWNPPAGRPEIDDLIWFDFVHAEGLPPPSPRERPVHGRGDAKE